MAASRTFFRDHYVLLLLSINAFLTVSTVVYVLLQLGSRQSASYIVQYRQSLENGQNMFAYGGLSQLLSFILFAVLIFGIHSALSLRSYHIKRQLSLIILCLGLLLLVINVIVANALLALR